MLNNKIICGNCLEELGRLDDDSIDLIITSPPYFKQRKYTESDLEIGEEETVDKYIWTLRKIFNECYRICKPTGNIVFNIGDKYIKGSLQLIPHYFAIAVTQHCPEAMLINDITWVKTNPTPKPHKKRLVNTTESFFHFAKSKDYYYNIDSWYVDDFQEEKYNCEGDLIKRSEKKGKRYFDLIKKSNLSIGQQVIAQMKLGQTINDYQQGIIEDFRMKIKGIHKPAYGGQQGGRNNEMEKKGFTIIRMSGKPMKRDIIDSPVANTKNIDHPAVFPLEVIKSMIRLLSKENDVVLDPFSGSGTVCVAAKQLNRRYIGIDLNPDYCKSAEERILKC